MPLGGGAYPGENPKLVGGGSGSRAYRGVSRYPLKYSSRSVGETVPWPGPSGNCDSSTGETSSGVTSTINSVSASLWFTRRNAAPIQGNSPRNGIFWVLACTLLEISPAIISVSPKFISTSVLTLRVIRLGTVIPCTTTVFDKSFELTSGLTCILSRPLERIVGTNSSCTPNDL